VTAYIALLRGVNVGGRQLKMTDLKAIADKLGYEGARTFIASGNLLFASQSGEALIKRELEAALKEHFGKAVAAMVRTAEEMAAVAAANPFADQPGNRVVAIFFDEPQSDEAIATARNVDDERLALGNREIYVHFPSGQGRSKLKLGGGQAAGTARNMNTVAKLAQLARDME
jgi:uncharacterized protein (DUF1697 family)